jgi:hypothetical protein
MVSLIHYTVADTSHSKTAERYDNDQLQADSYITQSLQLQSCESNCQRIEVQFPTRAEIFLFATATQVS